MVDERTRYFRRLGRLRRSARRWSVLAGTFVGATGILVPYRGLGWPDAIWAALSGGSMALAFWRWSDARELAAAPVPEPPDPERLAAANRARIEAFVSRLPAGRGALAEVRRFQARSKLRGSSVLPTWNRLDRAATTMRELSGRLSGPAASARAEAEAGEVALRELGERTAAVERACALTPGDAALAAAHRELLDHFTGGVEAYERLVGAAAGYVAQDGRTAGDPVAVTRLREATDLLKGIADGLAELRVVGG